MTLNVRRVVMDVNWASNGPGIVSIATAVHGVAGVSSCNITVEEIDMETVGTNVTVEGAEIDVDKLMAAIVDSGAVVHSVDQLVTGESIIDAIERMR